MALSPVPVSPIGSSEEIVNNLYNGTVFLESGLTVDPQFIGYEFTSDVEILLIEFTSQYIVSYDIILDTAFGPISIFVSSCQCLVLYI